MLSRRLLLVLSVFLTLFNLSGCTASPNSPAQSQPVTLLTTTSFQDTGLADVLRNEFQKQKGYVLNVISLGTGAALKQGASGEGDVLLVHAPEEELRWMSEGNGSSRRLVMFNDFVVVGPADDPAKIKGTTAVEAFRLIAAANAPFISRGDKSGTHTRELALWKKAGIEPKEADRQRFYTESGSGMGLTLEIASEQNRYTLSDRSTFLIQQPRLTLILVENDPSLLNLYHVITVNPQRFPKVNAAGAEAFAAFLVSPEGQRLIGEFGKERFGKALFTPAAGRTEEEMSK